MREYVVGDEVMVPDGYHANGEARPWKPGTIVELRGSHQRFSGPYLQIKLADGTVKTCPAYGVRPTPTELNQDAALMDCMGI